MNNNLSQHLNTLFHINIITKNNNNTSEIKMSNKYKILELLKESELTVKELAERLEFDENMVRVYIHRLKKDNLIKEIGKKNRYIIYTAIKQGTQKSSELVKYLEFINEFFKSNIDYLLQNPKIDRFIEENEKMFNRIEQVIINA